MIDPTATIHPTAIIAENVSIGANVSIGPYSIIGDNVSIGEGCSIGPHVVIKGPTTIGKGNKIFQFASIGEDCQDLKYAGEPTQLVIGDYNQIRESVTIHRGTVQDQGITRVGSRCLFMVNAHIAHDCIVGDQVILANNVTLAGHVQVGNHAILGGQTAVHQFGRIGEHAFIGGYSAVNQDVPPYVMASGHYAKPHGINSEGLKRRGYTVDDVRAIKRAYRIIFRSQLTIDEAIAQLEPLAQESAAVAPMLAFISEKNRGIIR